jgi:hypothetical protein
MTDFEDRARSASTALRRWMPDDPTPSPTAAVRRAVRRTRVHRATAGTLLVAVLGGVGLAWGPSDGGDDVRIDPAVTEPTGGAGEPGTTPTTGTPATTEASEPASPTCTGQVNGTSITFRAALPAGWHANEAALGEPACHHLGPQPIELRPTETESGMGVASNAVVRLYVSMGPGGIPTTFDEAVDDEAGNSESSRRTTVDGHPAARFERLTGPGDDVPVGGDRYVHWKIDLGDVWFDAVTLPERGGSYEESAAAIDQIVGSLRLSG